MNKFEGALTNGIKEKSNKDCPAIPVANMESNTSHAPLGAQEVEGLAASGRVSLHIHSRRKRLCDADGISGKAVIDGLVHAGLLQDDSPRFVEKVSYSQEKADTEETVIDILYEDEIKP